jgi:hypothetical protein
MHNHMKMTSLFGFFIYKVQLVEPLSSEEWSFSMMPFGHVKRRPTNVKFSRT